MSLPDIPLPRASSFFRTEYIQAKERHCKINHTGDLGRDPQIWRGHDRKFEGCEFYRGEFPSKDLGDNGETEMSRMKYSSPLPSSGPTSMCARLLGPAAGTGSPPEIPGPRAAAGTVVAGARLQHEGEVEGALWVSGPHHSSRGDYNRTDFNFHFISNLCARELQAIHLN